MEHLTISYNSRAGTRVFKAPSNMLYAIYGAHFANITSVGNYIGILRRHMEENDSFDINSDNPIVAFTTTIGGEHSSISLPEPIKTKSISSSTANSNPIFCIVVLYYKLVKATIPELIWEFLKRGKNP